MSVRIMPESSSTAIAVTGSIDSLTLRHIQTAAAEAGMSVDDFVLASAAHQAAFASVMKGFEQAQRGEFYEGTVEDIIEVAKAARRGE